MTKQEHAAVELYEKLTDYEHEGLDSIGSLAGSEVRSVELGKDEIYIELENGDTVVLATKYISKGD